MFLLNSCLGQFSAACFQAPLLPKLRGHFAEFLNNASSVGLRILSSSTCVGLRYGCSSHNSGFSWHMAHTLPYFCSVHVTSSDCPAVFPTGLLPRLYAAYHSAPMLSTCVPPVLVRCSAGISTCCPSATSLDLALGPDFPRADQLYSGNLGYSAGRIPTFLSLLIPAFSLQWAPQLLTVLLRRPFNAPLPHPLRGVLSFGVVFQPRTFSAQDLSTSELLRTL